MDPYALAAMEAQAWQDEAARNKTALARQLREIADDLDTEAEVSRHGSLVHQESGVRLLDLANRLRDLASDRRSA